MKGAFNAIEIAKDVYWVGAIDWAVRDFHGYLTRRGTTYNAFLVLADRVTLIDTVKTSFEDEMMARIASVVDPLKIDYLVSNHAEPDHAGAMGEVIRTVRPEKVFASREGARTLARSFNIDGVEKVTDGQTISLGNREITLVETPMCHWPESMVCYLHDEEILFSQDGFGMHLAGYERFSDEVDGRILDEEAARYYANILLPLGAAVSMTLDRITKMGISIKVIAPDHGPVWRTEPERIIEKYAVWARQERTTKAVVVYDTMWGSTDRMARAVGEGLASGGVGVKLMPVGGVHRSDIASEILDAGALLVGAPTLNSMMFPSIADIMTYLKGLRPRGLVGAVFGSFGWSGEGSEEISKIFEEMRVEIVDSPLGINYSPDSSELQDCYRLGAKVAACLHELRGKEG